MQVAIIYDVPGWSYWRRAKALQKHAPPGMEINLFSRHEVGHEVAAHDVVFQLCYGMAAQTKRFLLDQQSSAAYIVGFNVGWGYRKERFDGLLSCADHVVFNNIENWEKWGRLPRTSAIPNGVDLDAFYPLQPGHPRTPKVLWTGSHFHRKNQDIKGYDSHIRPLGHLLDSVGIDHDFRCVDSHGGKDRLDARQMNEWYNSGTVYINASEVEGAVNPPLEATAAGCVVVSTPVGNMPQFIADKITGVLVSRDVASLYLGVQHCVKNYRIMWRAAQQRVSNWGWNTISSSYYQLFREVLWATRRKNP